jgi:hypothetical protein
MAGEDRPVAPLVLTLMAGAIARILRPVQQDGES